MNFRSLFVAVLLGVPVWAPPASAQETGRNLLQNGDFETPSVNGKWPGWKAGNPNTALTQQNGNRVLSLQTTQLGATAGASQAVALEPDWGYLRFSGRVRVQNVQAGAQSHQDARLSVMFQDAQKKQIGGWPAQNLDFKAPTAGWREFAETYAIPPSANSRSHVALHAGVCPDNGEQQREGRAGSGGAHRGGRFQAARLSHFRARHRAD